MRNLNKGPLFPSIGTTPSPKGAAPKAAIEGMVEADPVAARVRDIMADRTRWTGQASDLLRGGADASVWTGTAGWPTSPRALAGRLRRAQTSLRTLGIEIA